MCLWPLPLTKYDMRISILNSINILIILSFKSLAYATMDTHTHTNTHTHTHTHRYAHTKQENGGEFESNYSNIYPEELRLSEENIDKHEASFLDLNIKIKDGKFHFGLFDKRDSFPFSIVRMLDIQVTYHLV